MTHTATYPLAGVQLATAPAVAGLDLLTDRERDADHLARGIGAVLADRDLRDITIATHWAQVGHLRHVALSIEATGDPVAVWELLARMADGAGTAALLGRRFRGEPELRETVGAALVAHTSRASGRVVVFPGSARIVGTLTVGEVLSSSAIDRIRVLAGGPADAASMLQTRDFVRPRWSCGQLVLDVQPAAGGLLVPFETPTPTPCCAAHGPVAAVEPW
jgi:hypothetical protein